MKLTKREWQRLQAPDMSAMLGEYRLSTVAELYLDGTSLNQLSTMTGIRTENIRKQMQAAGVPIRTRSEARALSNTKRVNNDG